MVHYTCVRRCVRVCVRVCVRASSGGRLTAPLTDKDPEDNCEQHSRSLPLDVVYSMQSLGSVGANVSVLS